MGKKSSFFWFNRDEEPLVVESFNDSIPKYSYTEAISGELVHYSSLEEMPEDIREVFEEMLASGIEK